MSDAQTEISVDLDCAHGPWVEVQTVGFGGTDIGARFADRIEGEWSDPGVFFRPEESDRSGVLVYAAKAHPEQEGAELAVTYVANHTDFATLVADETLYFPRFVRVEWK
jgi:hypothetical protein